MKNNVISTVFSVCEDCYGKEGPSLFSMGPRERGRIKG